MEEQKQHACVECRQQKVKCIRSPNNEGICDRCSLRNLNCVVDLCYKRTAKRRRFLEMEKEVQELKKRIAQEERSSREVSSEPQDMYKTGPFSSPPRDHPLRMQNPKPLQPNQTHPEQQFQQSIQQVQSQYQPQLVPAIIAQPVPLTQSIRVPQTIPNIPPVHQTDPCRTHYNNQNTLNPTSVDSLPSVQVNTASLCSREKRHTSNEQVQVKNWNVCDKTFKDLTLDADTVKGLFQEFLDLFHPVLPIVDLTMGPEGVYTNSSALFWTIMAVASRHGGQSELISKLSDVQQSCLSEMAVSPVIHSLSGKEASSSLNIPSYYAVQAFVISALWPPPTSSLTADNSWNFSGIALFIAIRAGLHCPGSHREFGRVSTFETNRSRASDDQSITWLAANAVSQIIAGMFGYPSISSFNYFGVLQSLDMPNSLRIEFIIQMTALEIERSLNANTRDPVTLSSVSDRLSLIRILSMRLDELDTRYRDKMDNYNIFSLLAVRYHLYSYYFIDNREITPLQRQCGVVSAYNAALALLAHVSVAVETTQNFMKTLGLFHIQLMWQAASLINRIYHSDYGKFIDREQGQILHTKTIEFVREASVFDHDIPFRASEIMQQMWQVFDRIKKKNNERLNQALVSVRTRMGTSVFFDSLWLMRDECEILSHAPTILTKKSRHKSSSHRREHGTKVQRPKIPPAQHSTHVPTPSPITAVGTSPYGQSPGVSGISSVGSMDHSPLSQADEEQLAFDWDLNDAWNDVNSIIENFGFQLDRSLGQSSLYDAQTLAR